MARTTFRGLNKRRSPEYSLRNCQAAASSIRYPGSISKFAARKRDTRGMYSRNFTGGQSNPAGFITACLGIPASAKRFHPPYWLVTYSQNLSLPRLCQTSVFCLFIADTFFLQTLFRFWRESFRPNSRLWEDGAGGTRGEEIKGGR